MVQEIRICDTEKSNEKVELKRAKKSDEEIRAKKNVPWNGNYMVFVNA